MCGSTLQFGYNFDVRHITFEGNDKVLHSKKKTVLSRALCFTCILLYSRIINFIIFKENMAEENRNFIGAK